MSDQSNSLNDIDKMLEENQKLIDTATTAQVSSLKSTIMTPNNNNGINNEIDFLTKQFLVTFSIALVVGVLVGAFLVVCCIKCSNRRAEKRLADLQANPAFRFQETTDPSASHGGIPASNPIADIDL